MEKRQGNRKIALLGALVLVYVGFCLLFIWLGPYNFAYMEQQSTFYFNNVRLLNIFDFPGGFCQIASDFLKQFFVSVNAGIGITALLLTLIVYLTARLIRALTHTIAFIPLALLPTVFIAYLNYNSNYLYSGNIAVILMLLPLNGMIRDDGTLRFLTPANRLVYTGACTILLYTLGGAISMLYGIVMFFIKLCIRPGKAVFYLCSPLITLLLGSISVYTGVISDLAHAVTPEAFFTARLHAPTFVYAPWIVFIVLVLLTGSMYRVQLKMGVMKYIFWSSLIVVIVTAIALKGVLVTQENETFKRLNYHIANEQWEQITDICENEGLKNLLLQNCRSLALAEQSLLADSLFDKPVYDIRTIYIADNNNPFLNMLLSDVYYSMGHIALAQRAAFEANESFNNASPRMLKRLVETNMIYGNYEVAKKYLKRLQMTLYYKGWANEMMGKLSDEAVENDSILSVKRKCIFPDNRFSGFKGLDDDLKQIIRANPEYTPTLQYLGCLYLLTKDLRSFTALIEDNYGTETLPKKLPKVFEEGIVQAATSLGADSLITKYSISPLTLQRFEDFKTNPVRDTKNYWYFYNYSM